MGLYVNLRRGAVNNLVVNRWNDIDKLCSTMILQSGTGVRQNADSPHRNKLKLVMGSKESREMTHALLPFFTLQIS